MDVRFVIGFATRVLHFVIGLQLLHQELADGMQNVSQAA